MKLIYIAGPYRSATVNGIYRNIQVARDIACDVWAMGAAALCPHTNSAMMDGAATDETFLAGGLEMLVRCDAVLVAPGYLSSKGTVEEIILAMKLCIPVFYHVEDLAEYLSTRAPNGPAESPTPDLPVTDTAQIPRRASQFFNYAQAYQNEEDDSDVQSAESRTVNPAKVECKLSVFSGKSDHSGVPVVRPWRPGQLADVAVGPALNKLGE